MQELEKAVGGYLGRYYSSIISMTRAMQEFKQRGLSKSIFIAPGRMIDEVEKQLSSYRENDNDSSMGSTSSRLPVVIIALSKDYIPAMGGFSNQLSAPVYIQLPDDEKDRVFKVRQMLSERRVQIAFIGSEVETVRGLIAQFNLFVSSKSNRTFRAIYNFAGQDIKFPVMLEENSIMASNINTEHKNLTILTLDITLKEAMPLFDAPSDACENDGKGTDGDINDPHGYPVVKHVLSIDESATGASVVSAKTPIKWDENPKSKEGYSEVNGLNAELETEKSRHTGEESASIAIEEKESE